MRRPRRCCSGTIRAASSSPDLRAGFADQAGERIHFLDLLTTEKDLARLKDDAAAAMLAERADALPVTMKIAETDAFTRLVLGACAKLRPA